MNFTAPYFTAHCNALISNPQRLIAELGNGTELSGYCFGLASGWLFPGVNHILGPGVSDIAQEASAFFYRNKYSPICYNWNIATHPSWLDSDGVLLGETTMDIPGVGTGIKVHPPAIIMATKKAMSAQWDAVYKILGVEEGSVYYLNYQGSPNVPNWQRSYFGNNTARLAQAKAKYDPLSIFSKPLVVDGVNIIRDE